MKHKKNGKERAARVGCSARPKKTSIWYRGFVFFYSFRSFVRNVFLFFFAFIGTCVQVATQSGGSPARRKKKNTHKHQVPPPQKKEKTKKKTLIKQKKKKTAKEEPSKGEPWRARSSIKKNNNNKKKKKSGRPFDEPSSSFVFSLRSFFSSTSFFLLDFFSFLFFCFFWSVLSVGFVVVLRPPIRWGPAAPAAAAAAKTARRPLCRRHRRRRRRRRSRRWDAGKLRPTADRLSGWHQENQSTQSLPENAWKSWNDENDWNWNEIP